MDFTIQQKRSALFAFLIPLILSGGFQSAYAMINSSIVGRVVSTDAVAAIGACSSYNSLLSHLFAGSAAGISVYLSRCIGTGNLRKTGEALKGAGMILLGLSLLVLPAAVEPRALLHLSNVSEQLEAGAAVYLRLLVIGASALGLKGLLIGLLQGFGNSRIPSLVSVASVVIQTCLVVLLVGKMGMGVAGSALATILNNCICSVVMLGYAIRRYKNHLEVPKLSEITGETWRELASNAVSKVSMMLILWVGSFTFSRQMNLLPTDVIAAHAFAASLNSICIEIISAFGTGASVAAGQNYGAGARTEGWLERIRYYIHTLLLWGMTASFLILLLYLCGGRSLIHLLSGRASDSALVESAVRELRIAGFGYFGLTILLVGRYSLQAMGHYRIQPVLGAAEMTVNLVSAAFVTRGGSMAIGLNTVLKWTLPGLLAGYVFLVTIRKLTAEAEEERA